MLSQAEHINKYHKNKRVSHSSLKCKEVLLSATGNTRAGWDLVAGKPLQKKWQKSKGLGGGDRKQTGSLEAYCTYRLAANHGPMGRVARHRESASTLELPSTRAAKVSNASSAQHSSSKLELMIPSPAQGIQMSRIKSTACDSAEALQERYLHPNCAR